MARPRLISTLAELPTLDTIGIVIGIDTRIFTTLAVASAARHLRIPLLVIDGYSTDGSFEVLRDIELPVETWLIRMERRIHGIFIDKVISEIDARYVLLIDSDVEVKTPLAFEQMVAALTVKTGCEQPFGGGCTHGDHTMETDAMPHAWFCRRPWIPFAMFDRRRCLSLIREGHSFEAVEIGNELPLRFFARLLALRWKMRVTRSWSFAWLRPFRKLRRGVRAAFYVYDTGATLYEAAELRDWHFAEIPWDTMIASVSHYDGATRHARSARWTGHSDIELHILATLKTQYGIELVSE
jgi:hypothetical protein